MNDDLNEENNTNLEQNQVDNTSIQNVQINNTPVNDPTVEPMEIPEKKHRLRRGTIPKLLLSFVLFVAGIALIVYSIRYEEPANVPDTNEIVVPDDNTTVTNEYAGTYVFNKEKDGNSTLSYDVIVLRDDYSFIYDIDAGTSSAPKVGTYTVLDGVITLEEKVSYGLEVCFFTEEDENTTLNTHTGTFVDGNLVITKDESTLTFVKDGLSEYITVNYDDAWYVVNPIDGERPENTLQDENETWRNCNNIEN